MKGVAIGYFAVKLYYNYEEVIHFLGSCDSERCR